MREESTQKSGGREALGWAPSVFYSDILVNCTLENAWKVMLDYEAWNPTFIGAEVAPVSGKPGTEGEVVLIRKSLLDVKGEPLPEFYAETVKLAPHRHIVWYVYPREGDAFCNFIEFGLAEVSSGVKFSIDYYAQNQLSGELLIKFRKDSEASLHESAVAFKNYCEAN